MSAEIIPPPGAQPKMPSVEMVRLFLRGALTNLDNGGLETAAICAKYARDCIKAVMKGGAS